MPKEPITINFSKGLDTKTDKFQVPVGNFLKLENSIFTKAGEFKKRNGFGPLPSLPDDTSTYVTTFNGDITAIGDKIRAFSPGNKSWVTKGQIQPCDLSILPLIRNNTNQSQSDTAINSNFVCMVYTDQDPTNLSNKIYRYAVADSTTGQNIIAPTTITLADQTFGTPKVWALAQYFIVVFSTSTTLRYIAINTVNLSVTAPALISPSYVPATTLAFDGVVYNNRLYIAWNTGTSVRVDFVSSALVVGASPADFPTQTATHMSVTSDQMNGTIWVTYYDSATQIGNLLAVAGGLGTVLTPTNWTTTTVIDNVTSVASNKVLTIYYEVDNDYIYDASIPTHFINTNTMTQAGVLGTPSTLVRSVGLASKAFIVDGSYYFLSVYQSPYQNTYFLLNSLGQCIAKIAYENGGGYYTTGLPNVDVSGFTFNVSYLFKDLVEAVNKNTNVPSGSQVNGIYSQTGINMAIFNFDADINSIELGKNLNLTGGFLWAYDGYSLTEQNFFLYPDSVEVTPDIAGGGMAHSHDTTPVTYFYQVTYEWTDNQGNAFKSAPSIPVKAEIPDTTPITFTTTFNSGDTVLTVSSVTGLVIGQYITDNTIPANIQADTFITEINGSTITLNLPTTGDSAAGGTSPDTLQTADTGSVDIDIPTLRLTYKTANPVKIVIYRWSNEQPIYYQVTSIFDPLLNDLTVDSVTFTDTSSDQQILGNNIIYTNGGVIEDINPPATSLMTIFDTRLWVVDSEDKNLVWYSKQVIENTPVEMSDVSTLYISPTIGAQGTPGPITSITNMDDKLIMSLGGTSFYYINGTGPDNTDSNSQYSQPTFITSTVGCANQRSIVFIPQGLVFQSNKGIWLLGRDLSTSYLGAPVEDFNDFIISSAINVPGTNQVRFTLSNGVILMYDYYYNQWGTFTGISAISSTIYLGLHTYIDKEGEVFQETPDLYLDGGEPVCMSFITSWLNLASLRGYERIHWFTFLGKYFSPHKLLVSLAYDYNSNPSQTELVQPLNIPNIYGSDNLYGGSSPYGGSPLLEQERIFAERQLCKAFQISITEIYDPSFGLPAGQGLSLSGISPVVTIKKGWAPTPGAQSVG